MWWFYNDPNDWRGRMHWTGASAVIQIAGKCRQKPQVLLSWRLEVRTKKNHIKRKRERLTALAERSNMSLGCFASHYTEPKIYTWAPAVDSYQHMSGPLFPVFILVGTEYHPKTSTKNSCLISSQSILPIAPQPIPRHTPPTLLHQHNNPSRKHPQ